MIITSLNARTYKIVIISSSLYSQYDVYVETYLLAVVRSTHILNLPLVAQDLLQESQDYMRYNIISKLDFVV